MLKKELFVILLVCLLLFVTAFTIRGLDNPSKIESNSNSSITGYFTLFGLNKIDAKVLGEYIINRQLRDENFKHAEVKTRWKPEIFRVNTGKKLVKMFPFPIVNGVLNPLSKTSIYTNSVDQWEHFGIRGVGVVTSVDYFKQDPKYLLIGTEGSGLYKSNNFGSTWKKIEFPTNNINVVAIDPNNKDHFLVFANRSHLFESLDGGESWDKLYTTNENFGTNNIFWYDNYIALKLKDKILVNVDGNWEEKEFKYNFSGPLKLKQSGVGLIADKIGGSVIYMTKDRGISWKKLYTLEEGQTILAYDISNDGKRIVIAGMDTKKYHEILLKSFNGGKNWVVIHPKIKHPYCIGVDAQDLFLSENDPNYIAVFYYMWGLFESFDGGYSFTQVTGSINETDESPVAKKCNNCVTAYTIGVGSFHGYRKISHVDLRFRNMKVLELRAAPGIIPVYKRIYLLPTDQGLVTYDSQTKKIKSLTNGLYLGDSLSVTLSKCPRVYAGLWHVGGYFIGEDGYPIVLSTDETAGGTVRELEKCKEEVFFGSGLFLEGGKVNDKKTHFSWNNDLTSEIKGTTPIFHKGWWYTYGWGAGNYDVLGRTNKDFTLYEKLYSSPVYFDFYIDNKSNYWITKRSKIYYSKDIHNLFKNELPSPLNNSSSDFDIAFVDYPTIAVAKRFCNEGDGLFVSKDWGQTWKGFFPYTLPSNIVKDKYGNLYVGLYPSYCGYTKMLDYNTTGVWFSQDGGDSWQPFKKGAEKSWISSLVLDENTNILYASTHGESLLKIKLKSFDLLTQVDTQVDSSVLVQKPNYSSVKTRPPIPRPKTRLPISGPKIRPLIPRLKTKPPIPRPSTIYQQSKRGT